MWLRPAGRATGRWRTPGPRVQRQLHGNIGENWSQRRADFHRSSKVIHYIWSRRLYRQSFNGSSRLGCQRSFPLPSRFRENIFLFLISGQGVERKEEIGRRPETLRRQGVCRTDAVDVEEFVRFMWLLVTWALPLVAPFEQLRFDHHNIATKYTSGASVI